MYCNSFNYPHWVSGPWHRNMMVKQWPTILCRNGNREVVDNSCFMKQTQVPIVDNVITRDWCRKVMRNIRRDKQNLNTSLKCITGMQQDKSEKNALIFVLYDLQSQLFVNKLSLIKPQKNNKIKIIKTHLTWKNLSLKLKRYIHTYATLSIHTTMSPE